MITYPLHFSSQSSSLEGIETPWNVSASGIESRLTIPPEFDGPGGGLSPEDLFNQAITNCFIATFKVYAQMSKLSYEKVTAQSKLTVDVNENKKPVMKTLDVDVQIFGAADADKALRLAKRASESGFIINSVKTDCHFKFEIC